VTSGAIDPAASAPVFDAYSDNGAADTPVASDTIAPPPSNDAALTDVDHNVPGWAIGAGALALLGIGGAFALSRRGPQTAARQPIAEPTPEPRVREPIADPVAAPRQKVAMPPVDPYATTALAADRTASTDRAVRPAPIARGTGQPFWAPVDRDRLERMIAARPTPENPFVSRPNRKRRALFLLRRQPAYSQAA